MRIFFELLLFDLYAFSGKERIKGAHPGLTPFVAKLQTTYKINGTMEYSFLPGWWEVSCQWTRRRIQDKNNNLWFSQMAIV